MALYNLTRSLLIPVRVVAARSRGSRMAGLFALDQQTLARCALHLAPCSAIHTFMLPQAIDVLFLDHTGRIVKICAGLAPNRTVSAVKTAHSVLEAQPGVLPLHQLQPGDQLAITAESVSRPAWSAFSPLMQIPVNFILAMVWLRIVLLSMQNLQQTHSWIGLGLTIFNSLLVFFFLFRRSSSASSQDFRDWLIPFFTILLSMRLAPDPVAHPVWQNLSLLCQGLALAAMCYSLLCLGKSFGIVPAKRTVKIHGAYGLVRHPLYASELIFYLGFLLGHFNEANLVKVVLILMGQLWRIRSEERLLNQEVAYQAYCLSVPHRLWPGIY
jgi:protein-S-isoprenylcysteine O-methyltransferase Ste14/uncharacterized membrane protein (UPF0127 family)